MKIEGNQKELDAMVEFHKGNRVEGLRLQEEFAAEFRKEYKDKDHCPCLKACRYHGNCKECLSYQQLYSSDHWRYKALRDQYPFHRRILSESFEETRCYQSIK